MSDVEWNSMATKPAPAELVLLAICKGELQCPVRGETYIALAVYDHSIGKWAMFGNALWSHRDDEHAYAWAPLMVPPDPAEFIIQETPAASE